MFHLKFQRTTFDSTYRREHEQLLCCMDTIKPSLIQATSNMTKSAPTWAEEKHPASTAALMASLHHLRKTNPKAVRSNVHIYPASVYDAEDDHHSQGSSSRQPLPDRRITSWKMTEHMYRQSSNPFPTLARGLFTEDVEAHDEIPVEGRSVEGEWTEDQQRERIVARGYDKFFNIDEVEWTNVSNCAVPENWLTECLVEAHGGPYTVPVLSDAEVQWVSYPRFCTLAVPPLDRFQTLLGNCCRE